MILIEILFLMFLYGMFLKILLLTVLILSCIYLKKMLNANLFFERRKNLL